MTAQRAPSRSMAHVVGLLLLLAGVVAASWRAVEQYRAPPSTPTTPLSTRTAALAVAEQAATPAPLAVAAEPPRVAVAPAAPAAASSATRRPAPGEVEVCGFGTTKADSPEADQLAARAHQGLDVVLDEHLRRMRASADERTRAAALMALGDHATLASLAMRTRDPTVYAFALQACLRRDARDPRAAQGCAHVSDEQATRLDPDNGAVWMKAADGARLRGETDNMVAALHRVAASTLHDPREFAFLALALDARPDTLSEAERVQLTIGLIGVQAGLSLPSHLALTTWCRGDLMGDANRRQLCDALARHLTTRGTLLIHAGIGRRIGERVGWSAERLERIRARLHAMGNAHTESIANAPGGPVGCAALRTSERWWDQTARLGERAVAEQWLAERGLDDAQLVARWREHQKRRAEAAASTPTR
jgi:hypothetical protein